MTRVSGCHRNLSKRDLRGYVTWLQQVKWQLFCTFTFAWPVSDTQAEGVFRTFIDRLEHGIHGPIAYLRGDEKRFSGCGKPGAPRHFHVLMTAHCRLDPRLVADVWCSLAGRRKNGAGADVRRYDPQLGGLAYTLKFIDQPGGNWDVRNLDLFLPRHGTKPLKCRQRRRASRQAKRLELGNQRTMTLD